MRISAFRKELELSQGEFALKLGLKSKSHMCEIERKNRCSPRIALEIERLSDGRIPAGSISNAVALVREADAA
jgi:transcriptional regulator with XRE-family HTH domain